MQHQDLKEAHVNPRKIESRLPNSLFLPYLKNRINEYTARKKKKKVATSVLFGCKNNNRK